jgi:protein SCO1/2
MYPTTFQNLVRMTAAWLVAAAVIVVPAMAGESAPAADVAPQQPQQQDGALRPSRMEPAPDELKNITVDEKLNTTLPLDLTFFDETNRPVQLREYFGGKRPVVLQLGYYGCPMLCDLVSRGLTDSLRQLKLDAATDYEVVFVSIDANETFQLAQQKKRAYVQAYGRAGADTGWHFLTGRDGQIKRLAEAVGFNYKWVPSARQFSHPAAIVILTPDGKISRYLYGVQFKEQTVRLSLVEASEGKVGSTVDKFMLTCLQYDGKQGKYAMFAMGLMRTAGVVTVVVIGGILWRLFRRERLARAAMNDGDDHGGGAPGGRATPATV